MAAQGFTRLKDEHGDAESGLTTRANGSWPKLQVLNDLFEEREIEGLNKLTSDGGAVKLAEMLGSSVSGGIAGDAADVQQRQKAFGTNAMAEKQLKSYLELVCDGLHDMINALLLVMAAISFVVEMLFGEHPETGWIESVAIVVSVAIIVNVSAATDYAKERTFRELSAQLDASNKKLVTRKGQLIEVEDHDLVVGDVLNFNAHNLASIPCDGILISGAGVKMDESSLTGEPDPQVKTVDGAPWIVSGTSAVAGSGKLLVVAVGANSVSGKIRAAVYGEDVEEEVRASDPFGVLLIPRFPSESFASLRIPSHPSGYLLVFGYLLVPSEPSRWAPGVPCRARLSSRSSIRSSCSSARLAWARRGCASSPCAPSASASSTSR